MYFWCVYQILQVYLSKEIEREEEKKLCMDIQDHAQIENWQF